MTLCLNYVVSLGSSFACSLRFRPLAVYGIEPVEMLAGSLPKRQQRLVEAWAELHQAELVADWDRLQTGHKALPIAPLA